MRRPEDACQKRFLVSRLDSQGAKACKSCRSRQEFSIENEYLLLFMYLQNLASIQPRTGLSKFAKNWPKVRKQLENAIQDLGAGADRGAEADYPPEWEPRIGNLLRRFPTAGRECVLARLREAGGHGGDAAQALEAMTIGDGDWADRGAGAMRRADAKRRAEADAGKLQEPEVLHAFDPKIFTGGA